MTYTYKFIPSSAPINVNPKQQFTNDFQQNLTQQFYLSSDWYQIQEESSLASGIYQDVDVRVNNILDSKIGDKIVDDDLKLLLFADINHPVSLGLMYKFDDNFWVTSNVDKIKSLVQTATVKRCNNMLRWQTPDGAIQEFPASLNFIVKQNRDYSTAGSAVVTPAGTLRLITQFNSVTNTIKPNQRFLFGNSNNFTAYRVEGGGIENYNNLFTTDNMSSGLIAFTLVVDYVNPDTDDITNGIANYIQGTYAIQVSPPLISGDATQTIQLYATVTFNGETVSRSVTWSSNDETIATVDQTGLVTFVAEGIASIKVILAGNDGVFASCDVEVTSTPVDTYQIIVSPTTNYLLEGDEAIWSTVLYKNNMVQTDGFTYSLNPRTVPDNHYLYEVLTPQEFKVHNYQMFLTDYLEVTATSGIYSIVIQINLRGAW